MATSCGMAVIWIRGDHQPTLPPISIAAIPRQRSDLVVARAVTTAIAMPSMPARLPRWLVVGLDRPRRAMMKQTPATR